MKLYFTFVLLMIVQTGFSQYGEMIDDGITRCVLIKKPFISKNGKTTDQYEWYLRCSVQDYFIKLCEGKVKASDLEPYLNKGIAVRMEVRDGNWDICKGDPEYAQSRIGRYAVILKIEKKESAKESDEPIADQEEYPDVSQLQTISTINPITAVIPDSIGTAVFNLIRHIQILDSAEFINNFMPLSEYKLMALDTTLDRGMRAGMTAVSEEQFSYRYQLVYQRFMNALRQQELNPSGLTFVSFEPSIVEDGGLNGLEGILILNYQDKKFLMRSLAIYRNGQWNLVEIDRLQPEN